MSSPAAAAAAAAETEQIVEVDTATPGESDYDSGLPSDTTSIASSVYNFTYDNGRRYTQWGRYLQPNDETEQDRLDIGHHLQNILLHGELYTAPIENPQRILDCGTGTGIWALDMGDKFPSAEVTGVDLSPIQPSWVAPNVKFEIDDLEKEWTWPENYFDFVHSRQMGLGVHDWKRYIEQIYTHLAPGGWVELSEQEQDILADDDSLEGSNIKKWTKVYIELAPKAGLHFVQGEDLEAILKEVGFVDVSVKTMKQPWGPWPKDPALKEIGKILTAITETSFDAHGLALFTKYGGWSTEDAKKLSRACWGEVCGRKCHPYNRVWHVIGRKPEN